jgi:hypothetical protein
MLSHCALLDVNVYNAHVCPDFSVMFMHIVSTQNE